MRAPDLATIDAALERARELTMRRLQQARKSPAWYRQAAAGKLRPWRPREERERASDMRFHRRDERLERRRCQVERGVTTTWDERVQAYYDELYTLAETRAQAEVRYAQIRALVADALERVASWARTADSPTTPGEFLGMAERLRQARRLGFWGVDLDSSKVVVRFADRSGLTILDPSEARERQAEIVRRLVPELVRLQAAGYRLYYAVASEPNVAAGSLAWGKAHLFERFRRVILGRKADGRAAGDGGPFPEIVGAFCVQEDPLAADRATWNVHLNLLLVVDPRQCTRLDADLVQQLELRLGGPVAKLPAAARADPTPRGCLSYAKLHYAWGSDQFHVAPLEGRDPERLGKSLLEVVKYTCKWVSNKQLDELAARAVMARSPEPVGDTPPAFELEGGRKRGRGRQAAPGVTEWPEARIAEWIEANRRFRRVRGHGLLYRLAADEREPDPDELGRIRWLGRVFISPRGAVVHSARLDYVSSIHGVKSGADFPASGVRSPGLGARAGPLLAAGAS